MVSKPQPAIKNKRVVSMSKIFIKDDSTKKFIFNKREGWFNRRYEQRDLIKWLRLRCIA